MANFIITVSIILIIVFIVLVIFFVRKAKKIKSLTVGRVEKPKTIGPEIINEHWQGILSHLNSANESEWKLAIIEADKIIDDLLIQKGYEG